ncbi:hypothetical protein NLG97_g3683 [Lecanicillium saksenae]|uniref:Uncharacterized protein n=1 Tax=Lecanicillium saksenae TaxID=468837 RepID=A0ACC1QYT3_9HYPO|nr:hypothetical protein NLG97_g3683 [Lecanicillium saksenae]
MCSLCSTQPFYRRAPGEAAGARANGCAILAGRAAEGRSAVAAAALGERGSSALLNGGGGDERGKGNGEQDDNGDVGCYPATRSQRRSGIF